MSLLPIDSHSSSKSQSILLFLETLLELLIPRDVIREVRVDFLYELAALWRRSRVMYLSVIETSVFGFGSHITPACAGIIFQFFPRRAGKIDNNFECKARGIIMKITPTCFSTRGYFNIT